MNNITFDGFVLILLGTVLLLITTKYYVNGKDILQLNYRGYFAGGASVVVGIILMLKGFFAGVSANHDDENSS